MATSYTAFSNAVADVPVTGVVTAARTIPDQINTTLLPLSYPRLPEGDEGPLTTDGEGGWPTLTVERVFVLTPTAQAWSGYNHEQALTLVDNISTAFRAVATGQIGKSKIRWTMRLRLVGLGNTEYWCIILRVTGNG